MTGLHCILQRPTGHVETMMTGSKTLGLSTCLGLATLATTLLWSTSAQASTSGFRVNERVLVGAPAEDQGDSTAAPAAVPAAPDPATAAPMTGEPAPSTTPTDGGPGEERDMTPADAAAPLPAPAPAPAEATAPASTGAPETEGPTPEEYSSSKDAGTALSGGDVDDRTTETATLGKQKKEKTEKKLSHEKTGILGVAGGIGTSMITAGDKFCGEFSDSPQDPDGRKPLCVGRTPFTLDALVGFGATDRIDIIVNVRINLEKRDYDNSKCDGADTCAEGTGLFNNKLGIGVAPGLRIFGQGTDKIVKFGGVAQFMYMNESFAGYRSRLQGPMEMDDTDTDNADDEDGVGDHFVGLRGGPVLQIDPHHNFGITLNPAMIPGFRPKRRQEVDGGWFEIGFEVALGLEARFP